MAENQVLNLNLYGTYSHSIDDKNRFLFPAKLREKIEKYNIKDLVITAALPSKRYLLIFPEMIFQDFIRSWMSEDKGPGDPVNSSFEGWFNRMAFPVQLDKTGRLLIPQKLIEEKSIKKDICLVGKGNKIEIWDKEAFKIEDSRIRETLSKLKFE